MLKRCLLVIGLGVGLFGCSASAGGDQPTSTPTATQSTAASTETPTPEESPSASASPSGEASPAEDGKYHGLVPFPDSDAPEITEVVPLLMKTDVGDVSIEVYPQAAPNSAKRFLGLVEKGFYNDTPLFRVVPGFVVQFGVNWRKPHKAEKETTFKEDQTKFELEKGTLCFAKTQQPDSASTQVFINYANNSDSLRPMNFTVFGRVTKGMDVVEKFKDASGGSPMGLDQTALWEDGGNYLKSLPVQPDKIVKLEVVKPKK